MLVWVALVVLSLGLLAAFAAIAELARRVSVQSVSANLPDVIEPTPTAADARWPVTGDSTYFAVVLSSVCKSCAEIAGAICQLVESDPAALDQLRVVVAAPNRDAAEEYARRLPALKSLYLDGGGEWSKAALGVDLAPVRVEVRNGVPVAAVPITLETFASTMQSPIARLRNN